MLRASHKTTNQAASTQRRRSVSYLRAAANKGGGSHRPRRRSPQCALRLAALAALLAGAGGCYSPNVRDLHYFPLPHEQSHVPMPPHVVEPPDILSVEASETPPNRPINGEWLVRPDGTISFPFYGELYVAGYTLPEIEEMIGDMLEEHLRHRPEVWVDVASYNSKFYYVLGEVNRPTRLPVTGRETVLDAILLADGTTHFAEERQAYLVRTNPTPVPQGPPYGWSTPDLTGPRVYPIDLRGILRHGDLRTNYQLMAGDRIYVQTETTAALERALTPVLNVIDRFAGVSLISLAIFDSNRGLR